MLIVLSGLPGVGKTTIARELAIALVAVHVRVDSIEQAMRAAGWEVRGEGYAVAQAVASDNLRLGHIVIADSVNPWPLTRSAWRLIAEGAGVPSLDVEVVCSDLDEHRRRIESRVADIEGHRLPTWQEVLARDYHAWDRDRVVIDTGRVDVEEAVRAVMKHVPAAGTIPSDRSDSST
jgi:predicted kinase